ncbi:MAG: YbaK/EbsC family protein, partial [Actinomycetes bacterium]
IVRNNFVALVSETTGGVSPVGWVNRPEITLIDMALDEHEVAWAAAGHPHSVYPTSFTELQRVTDATPMVVGE